VKKAFFSTIVDALRRMPFWTLCVLFVALRVTRRFCKVSCGFHGHPATHSMNIRPLIPR
ncbi:IS91 family transposase, partial [Pseudomonas syringae pv. actinidiae]